MMHARMISLAVLSGLSGLAVAAPAEGPVTITFDKVDTGKPVPSYTDQEVVFALSRQPTTSGGSGRVMFIPHLKTPRKGILNAMAAESIPVEVRFPKPVSSVTLVLWGSIGSAALVEAYDKDDKVLDRGSRDRVPERTGPEQPIPCFKLTVEASAIVYVRFSGAPPGGYLVCDEVRFTPVGDAPPAAALTAPEQGVPWDVPPLKTTFKNKFLIGAALDYRRFQSQASTEIAIATTHFNAFTPENSMKPRALQPTEGHFNFAAADRLVELAEKSGAVPVGHCLVWHSQTPRWFFQGPDGQPAGRELTLARMRKHIAAVVGYYKGRVKQWDVVNEAISDTRGELLRQSPWLKAIGEDYIAEAFRAAHEADPDALLIYNDYDIERRDKRRKALQLLNSLIEQKVPVHAVGIQGHWRLDRPDLAEVEESIKQFAALGLKVMITELDVGVLPGRNQGADIARTETRRAAERSARDPFTEGLPGAVAQQQTERYRQAFAMFLRHQDVIGRVTFWGVYDGHTWLNYFPVRGRTDHPLLFDREGKPKGAFFAVTKAAQEASVAAPRTWTADNGNGTFTNPLFFDEFSDPDLIRVGEDFYLTGTTMHTFPGLPVLHSKDLVNWELLSYACDKLDLGPAFRLENGKSVYGRGIWAPSFRYHNGTFYIFTNVNRYKTQLFTATNPAGPWKRTELKRSLHDLSVLFDDDGKVYVVWGHREIRLAQLNERLDDIVPGSERIIIPKDAGMGEGSHFYKINGQYFITSAWFSGAMRMPCARAPGPEGPYEVNRAISDGEDFGIATGAMHQGGIVSTTRGEWWGFSMMDYNSVGRLTCLSPVTWQDGWPYFGLPGNLGRTPRVWTKPDTGHVSPPSAPYQRDDDFNGPRLANVWQWNHVPVDDKWSLTARPGFLRLSSSPASDFWTARNTLTQRAIGPESAATVELDPRGLQEGDVAGLALLNYPYAWLGIRPAAEGLYLEHYDQRRGESVRTAIAADRVWLRANCDFGTQKARMSYSTDARQTHFNVSIMKGLRSSRFVGSWAPGRDSPWPSKCAGSSTA